MNRLLLVCCIGMWLAACGTPEAPADAEAPGTENPFRNTAEGVAFVGDAACFDCHEAASRGFAEHGMARSFYPLSPENAVEQFPGAEVRHAASGFTYRAYREGDRFFQEEYREGPGGARTHHLVREMHYVVGSGTAARTYLTEQEGRLYELPLTWYTQARKWDLSPGYREHNGRFDRLIPDRCMACHNSYPATVPFVEGKYSAVPHGIGCERCHGPGALHVEARLASPGAEDGIDYTIVNPAHLSLDRRLDVCQQCHLHGDVSLLREGRTPYDFRPSQSLASYVAIFSEEKPAGDDQISVISHADRMKQSECFIQTSTAGGQMDCLTCHKPHEGFRSSGPDYFNRTCLTCHEPAALQSRFTAAARQDHAPGANCISCHMPRVEAEDAPHSSFTDHKIRVVRSVPAAPGSGGQQAGAVELAPYFQEQDADADLYAGMAYIVYARQQADTTALGKGISLLRKTLADRQGHGEARYLLGFALLQRGDVVSAIPYLEEAVRLDPGIPERLNTLAQAYETDRRSPEPIENLYLRALAVQPALAEVRVNYGRFLEARGRLDEAMAQYRRAVDEQPWLPSAHYNLGTAYLRQQDFEAAEQALRQALTLAPDDPEALGNLGLLYAMQGRLEDARARFEHAVRVAPQHPAALGNLGAFYLNQDAPAKAIPFLLRAVEANPRFVDALANLALAYFRTNQPAPARRYAQQTLSVAPNNALARQILGAL